MAGTYSVIKKSTPTTTSASKPIYSGETAAHQSLREKAAAAKKPGVRNIYSKAK